jgi:hypothetical protein
MHKQKMGHICLWDGAQHRRFQAVAVLLAMLPLAGCGGLKGVQLYDATKAKTSTEAKENYAAAKVTDVIEIEESNLNKLLDKELEVVRENFKLQIDLRYMRMVSDNGTPMTSEIKKIKDGLKKLGLQDVKTAREFLVEKLAMEDLEKSLDGLKSTIRAIIGSYPPVCVEGKSVAELATISDLIIPSTVTSVKKKLAKVDFENYKIRCKQLRQTGNIFRPGSLKETKEAWRGALNDVLQVRAEIKAGNKQVKALANTKKQAADAVEKESINFAKTLKNSAGSATKVFHFGVSALNAAGIDVKEEENIKAISIVLAVVAGGAEAKGVNSPELVNAVTVLNAVGTLADDIAALQNKKRPNVANLVIELNHQLLIVEDAKKRLALYQRRADFEKSRFDALVKQARALKNMHDHLCNFAYLQSKQNFPGIACNAFTAAKAQKSICLADDKGVVVKDAKGKPTDCPLTKSWIDNLARSKYEKGAKHELYAALASLSQIHVSRSRFVEAEYRLIDLQHRKAVQANRFAIRAWNNLIAEPIDQLAAYHGSGIKTSEIADLIVKALGFAAITAGVVTDD